MSENDNEKYDPDATLPETIRNCAPEAGPVHAYLWWVTPTTHAPAQYHLGAILPALAFEAARRGIRIGNATKLPRLWVGLVGGSGHGKSTAHERAYEFVRDWYGTIKPEKPSPWPYFHLDGSMPGILAASATHFDDHINASLGIYEIDEFSKLLAGQDSVAETMCKIFDGRDVQRHLRQYQEAKRQGEKVHDMLRRPAFSGCFASTPSALERVTQSYHLEGGLYSRILWFRGMLKSEDLLPRERPRDRARVQALDLWIDWARWLDTQQLLAPERNYVEVPDDVRDFIDRRLFEPTRKELAHEDDRMNPTRLRALSFAEQIAGLFALSCGSWQANEEDAQAAINLVSACVNTMWELNRVVAVNDKSRLRAKLYQAIRDAGEAGLRRSDLYHVGSQCTRAELDEALSTLIDSEEVVCVIHQRERGRPATRYVIRQKSD